MEVFVTSLRRICDEDGNEIQPGDPLDAPVVSGCRIPWTIPHKDKTADPDGIAPANIPAGTFRYLSAIGPRRATTIEEGKGELVCALKLKPGPTQDRYDLDWRPGTWEAHVLVSQMTCALAVGE